MLNIEPSRDLIGNVDCLAVFINQSLFDRFYQSIAVSLFFFINHSLFYRFFYKSIAVWPFYQSIAAPEERLLARATTSYIAQIPKLDFW